LEEQRSSQLRDETAVLDGLGRLGFLEIGIPTSWEVRWFTKADAMSMRPMRSTGMTGRSSSLGMLNTYLQMQNTVYKILQHLSCMNGSSFRVTSFKMMVCHEGSTKEQCCFPPEAYPPEPM
jgi:hypothetical protein